jgi:hypothetical protein
MDEPPKTPESSGFRRLVVILAVVVAVAGAVIVYRDGLRSRAVPTPPPPPQAQGEEDDVQRALRLAGIDSTKKNEWVDEVPGADVGRLTSAQLATFVRFANAERCSCGCGFTLAACRRFDSTCEISGPRVNALLDSVARGQVRSPSGLRERPDPSTR